MNPKDFKMPFGSFKGKTLETIYNAEPDYLMWARDNLNGFVQDNIERYLCQKNREIVERGDKK